MSFDNEKIGASIAQGMVDHLKKANISAGLLPINGLPTDAAAGGIKKGVHGAVDTSGLKLANSWWQDGPEVLTSCNDKVSTADGRVSVDTAPSPSLYPPWRQESQ